MWNHRTQFSLTLAILHQLLFFKDTSFSTRHKFRPINIINRQLLGGKAHDYMAQYYPAPNSEMNTTSAVGSFEMYFGWDNSPVSKDPG